MRKARWLIAGLIVLLLGFARVWDGRAAEPAGPSVRPSTASAPEVNFLGMGDWGQINSAQGAVAKAMATYVTDHNIKLNAVLLAGDNFYGKLTGTNDPQWKSIFEDMYDPIKLSSPFYVTLGNHDYRDGKAAIELAYAQENPASRWKLPTKWYRVDFPEQHPLVSVLMLDSNRDNLVKSGEWARELVWLEAELAKVSAGGQWVMCCAHHTLVSNGLHGDNGVLQKEWGSLFKKFKVDIYLCGHDHDLQHLELKDWPMSFVLAGGGGKASRAMLRDVRGPFSKAMNGFAHFQFTQDKAVVRLVGKDSQAVHIFERTRQGAVNILMTTPSDKATTNPIKARFENELADLKSTSAPATAPAGK